MVNSFEFYSELILNLCQKHVELLDMRSELQYVAPTNITDNYEEYKAKLYTLSNKIDFTYYAIQLVRSLLISTPSYIIPLDNLKKFYDDNSLLSKSESVDLLCQEIQKLIGENIRFSYILLEDGSIQINLNN